MKIRTDFVTNSSSSSYIIVSKINYDDELKSFFKDEYGKYGERLLKEYLVTGKEMKENNCYDYEEFLEEDRNIEEDSLYLQASFISYTSEGDTEGDDAWLFYHLPEDKKEIIYEGDSDY